MTCQVHVNDIGTVFKVTITDCNTNTVVDISSADEIKILFKKPDGTEVEKTAALVNDGTDGLMSYTTESGFLDQAGSWKLQGYVKFGSSQWYTNYTTFKVHRNIL